MTDDPFLNLLHRLRGDLISEMPQADVILSAGCSGTWYFEWFSEKYPYEIRRHIGFDIESCPDKLPAGVEYHQRSFCDLSPIDGESIDLIFAGQAIEHVSTRDAYFFFEHAQRVLKPGGWLVMDSPNFTITDPWPYVNPDHVIEYTPKQMAAIVEAAGFQTANSKGLLLCRENNKVLDDPYDFGRIDQARISEAKARPDDSFIWWMETRKSGSFDGDKLSEILERTNAEYESCMARSARRRAAGGADAATANPPQSVPVASGTRQLLRRVVPRPVRRMGKATVKRVTGLYHRDQMAVLADIRDRVGALQATLPVISSKVDTQEELIALILQRLRIAEDEFQAVTHALQSSADSQRILRDDLDRRAGELDRVIRLLAPAASSTSVFWNPPSEQSGEDELVMSRALSDFYLEFQKRHRGSEELIRERQRGRVPMFASCKRVLDIGCGRGEFLELLKEEGIEAEGIDLSESSLAECEEKGLTAARAEALEFLAAKGQGTFDGIHMAHVLEHMPFGSAVQLLEACAEHLPPGGVLVAETPNPHSPEALQVFFLDPTHVRPLFPEALVVLFESVGFDEVEAHFLNPVRQQKNGAGSLPHDFADYMVVGAKLAEGKQAFRDDAQKRSGRTRRSAASA